MTDYFDPLAARRRYEIQDSESLIRIAFLSPEGYVPAAIELAREELSNRGISDREHPLVALESAELQKENAVEVEVSNAPLGVLGKAVCFIFADLLAIIISLVNFAIGKKRAGMDALAWMAFGWIPRLLLIAALSFR
ncbi:MULTISPECIES: hypothetical protein [unclassified Xanthomonas]|uniref:hypothetical protein n=1 Tax=unclassified Xanthomonas TaxID=2643310 RepID=UPI002882D947|nr:MULTISPECIES: hypothetical protein [unclassified Xanthomonas]